MFSFAARRFALILSVLVFNAPFRAPLYAAPPVKTKVPIAKKAAVAKPGTFVEGAGICSFKATISRGTSNAVSAPFASLNREEKYKRIVSVSRASRSRTGSSVLNLIYGPPEQIGPLRRSRTFSLTFASRGGFRVGQTFSIALPKFNGPPQTSACLMDYTENETLEREITRPSGRKSTRTTSKYRSWIAVSGTLRVDAVGEDGLFFSIKNARFNVPPSQPEQNYAEGAFVLNGKGVCTFNEE